MHWKRVTAVICALLASASAHARHAPADHCIDGRAISEAYQVDDRTIVLRGEDGRRHSLTLDIDCPAIFGEHDIQITGWQGWICGASGEAIRSDARSCPILATRVIDSRDYAAALQKVNADMRTLAPVVVKAKRRRGFIGTADYCVANRWLRSWYESGEGLFVEVSPRRSGGNRYYRIETHGNCGNQYNAESLSLMSAMGLGVVCGNAGDHVVFGRESRGALTGQALLGSPLPRAMPAIEPRCEISRVYPVER